MNKQTDLWDFGDYADAFGLPTAEDAEALRGHGRKAKADTSVPRPPRRATVVVTEPKQIHCLAVASERELRRKMTGLPLKRGHAYFYLADGDVGSFAFAKMMLEREQLDTLLCASWHIDEATIGTMTSLWERGLVGQVKMLLGDSFPVNYQHEWELVQDFYARNPEAGWAAVTNVHAKIYAGERLSDGYCFALQSSANMNTSEQINNTVLQFDRELFAVYADFFERAKAKEDARERNNTATKI